MSLKNRITRAGAVVGIATNLATVPVTKDGSPTLGKQYTAYSKEVRLPEIRREIGRNTTKTNLAPVALDKRTARRLRKP